MYNRVDGMLCIHVYACIYSTHDELCKDLVGKHQNSFEGEASGTEVEEVL